MKNNVTEKNVTEKKEKKKKNKWIGRIIFIAVIIGALIYLGAFPTVFKPGKIDGFAEAVTDLSGIQIPEGTRIVALGEATHGNKEFQELKLDVFKHLVETTNVRAFMLEGDMGGCALINEYVQGGEGDLKEMVKLLGYKIYRTDQMAELISWMREYNEKASEGDKVRIYGMDIQYDTRCIKILKKGYEKIGDTSGYSAKIDQWFGQEEDQYEPSKLNEILDFLKELESDAQEHGEEYKKAMGTEAYETFVRAAVNLEYYLHYRETENFSHKYRDEMMKNNVSWALEIEEREHNGALMISCHNDHMSQIQATAFTFLGVFLQEEYGDAYFTIGTDYYVTDDNIYGLKGGRDILHLCSDDKLAYQVKSLPENQYYLDFAKVNADSKLGKVIRSKVSMGSLGERYNSLYKFVKKLHQLKHVPIEKYDAMIFVYQATPIEVWE